MKYRIIDSESTGLKVNVHELTELSIIDCDSMVQKNWLFGIKNPKVADPFALQLTGKTIKELTSRQLFLEHVIDEIDEFVKDGEEDADNIVMIAHNASFDRRMVEYNWSVFGRKFPANYWLDTVNISKKYVKNVLKIREKVSFAQSEMIKLLNLKSFESQGQHSAEVDARNLYRMWNHMVKQGKISNTEFIKLSPAVDGSNVTKSNKKVKLNYNDESEVLEDIMDDLL